MSTYIEEARATDAELIANLVNMAYRPNGSVQGWTHEVGLVSGSRITTEQVTAMLNSDSTVLVMRDGDRVVACVNIECAENGSCYIGMLATDPEIQGNGIGKKMLAHAESIAVAKYSANLFKMSVLSSRQELIAYYNRRGYQLTGYSEQYPITAGVGTPIIEGLSLLSLEKKYP